jgi:hypothetical protein
MALLSEAGSAPFLFLRPSAIFAPTGAQRVTAPAAVLTRLPPACIQTMRVPGKSARVCVSPLSRSSSTTPTHEEIQT